jgi:hypothetical protein
MKRPRTRMALEIGNVKIIVCGAVTRKKIGESIPTKTQIHPMIDADLVGFGTGSMATLLSAHVVVCIAQIIGDS